MFADFLHLPPRAADRRERTRCGDSVRRHACGFQASANGERSHNGASEEEGSGWLKFVEPQTFFELLEWALDRVLHMLGERFKSSALDRDARQLGQLAALRVNI